MIEKDHGHIITIASMAGHVGMSKLVDYCASKFAAVNVKMRLPRDFINKIIIFFTSIVNRLDSMNH